MRSDVNEEMAGWLVIRRREKQEKNENNGRGFSRKTSKFSYFFKIKKVLYKSASCSISPYKQQDACLNDIFL